MMILHHCLMGEASPISTIFLLFLWTDAYLMIADVDSRMCSSAE